MHESEAKEWQSLGPTLRTPLPIDNLEVFPWQHYTALIRYGSVTKYRASFLTGAGVINQYHWEKEDSSDNLDLVDWQLV